MAFPTVAASSTSSEAVSVITHPVTIPTVSSGNAIIIFGTYATSVGVLTDPSGYTRVVAEYGTAGITDNYVFAKVADGTEAGTINVATSINTKSAHIVLVIDNWEGTLAGIEFSADNTSSSVAPDTLTLTPSWGSADTLWVSQVVLRRGRTVNTYPYADNNLYVTTGASNGNPTIALSSDELAQTTEDPAAYALDLSTNWWGLTMAVQPATPAGPTLTGPSSVTEGTPTATVGTGQDTVTTLSIQTTDGAFSVEQTKGATTATGITFTPASGINACSIGFPAAGVPLVPTVSAAGITAYATEIKEVAGATTVVNAVTVNNETGMTTVQIMTAGANAANTDDALSMLGSSWITAEDNMQYSFQTVTDGGMTITANPDGTYTTDLNQTETIPLYFLSPTTKQWSTLNFTITAAAVSGGAGRIPAADGTAAPTHFSGLPFDTNGKLAIDSTSAISHVSGGVPYTATGRVCVSLAAVVTRYNTGLPFDANGKLAMSNAEAVRVSNGKPYSASGQVAIQL